MLRAFRCFGAQRVADVKAAAASSTRRRRRHRPVGLALDGSDSSSSNSSGGGLDVIDYQASRPLASSSARAHTETPLPSTSTSQPHNNNIGGGAVVSSASAPPAFMRTSAAQAESTACLSLAQAVARSTYLRPTPPPSPTTTLADAHDGSPPAPLAHAALTLSVASSPDDDNKSTGVRTYMALALNGLSSKHCAIDAVAEPELLKTRKPRATPLRSMPPRNHECSMTTMTLSEFTERTGTPHSNCSTGRNVFLDDDDDDIDTTTTHTSNCAIVETHQRADNEHDSYETYLAQLANEATESHKPVSGKSNSSGEFVSSGCFVSSSSSSPPASSDIFVSSSLSLSVERVRAMAELSSSVGNTALLPRQHVVSA